MRNVSGEELKTLLNRHKSIDNAPVYKSTRDTRKGIFPIDDDTISRTTSPTDDKFCRTQLLLTTEQMVSERFPLPIERLTRYKYSRYVTTRDRYKAVTSSSPILGVDCEMCKTDGGELELTRVSLVDERCEVVYDQLVKPDNSITDYLTRYSGITASSMEGVTKRLTEVQADLGALVPRDAILVSQSLAFDLHALKMMHPYVIDTR